ncbi:MAG: molybdopterin-synthase adenylyltransferase MoeB [Verrucomicrobiota bacterium]|nr:molybdopterin-synthase adenylyltransferase MoeB [Verrucomicrobiota bacterium]
MTMTDEERVRYSRHLSMPEVGEEGQRRLKAGRILCLGAGGLGSPAALYLAAAGVGTLGLVDFDDVDLSNLQRQILHGTKDIGRKKIESARARLQDANPNITIEAHNCRFTSENAADLVARYDIVVDGSDNFPTRYLSNDVCVWAKKPNVYGSIFRFEGQATVFAPHLGGPCYRCLFPEPPTPGTVPSCAEAGVLGVLPGIIGTIQATEAIKLILGSGDPLVGRLLHFDALKMKFREFNIRRDPQCPVCGESPTITEAIDYDEFCGTSDDGGAAISVSELKRKIDNGDPIVIVDVREPFEYEIAHIENSKLIPLSDLPDHLDELDRAKEIVTLCHTGTRSAGAVDFLKGAGFERTFNLKGGIDAWAAEIDPTMQKY